MGKSSLRTKDIDPAALERLSLIVGWIDQQLSESRFGLRRGQVTANNGASWEPSDWLETLVQTTQELTGDKRFESMLVHDDSSELVSDDAVQNGEG